MHKDVYHLASLGRTPKEISDLLSIPMETFLKEYNSDFQKGFTKFSEEPTQQKKSIRRKKQVLTEEQLEHKRAYNREYQRKKREEIRRRAKAGDIVALQIIAQLQEEYRKKQRNYFKTPDPKLNEERRKRANEYTKNYRARLKEKATNGDQHAQEVLNKMKERSKNRVKWLQENDPETLKEYKRKTYLKFKAWFTKALRKKDPKALEIRERQREYTSKYYYKNKVK